MSAFQGDFIEQAPRRLFVRTLGDRQPVYSYCMCLFFFDPSRSDLSFVVSNIERVVGIGAVRFPLNPSHQRG